MRRLFALALLACQSQHSAYADEVPSLAKVVEGEFRFGFGDTNDQLVRQGLTQPGAPIRRVVETQINAIGVICFYPTWLRLFDGDSQSKPAFWARVKPLSQ